MIRIFIKIF
uniref:Uncharacterized protein n=1 Tax=Anguilla anguilla TaxID=7936 RepID=A0A0E9PV32_ANGAN